MGTVYFTGTGFPICFPGEKIGKSSTTSIHVGFYQRALSNPLNILTLPTVPSFSTTNSKITLPSTPFC